jgi:hypothetical protein
MWRLLFNAAQCFLSNLDITLRLFKYFITNGCVGPVIPASTDHQQPRGSAVILYSVKLLCRWLSSRGALMISCCWPWATKWCDCGTSAADACFIHSRECLCLCELAGACDRENGLLFVHVQMCEWWVTGELMRCWYLKPGYCPFKAHKFPRNVENTRNVVYE